MARPVTNVEANETLAKTVLSEDKKACIIYLTRR